MKYASEHGKYQKQYEKISDEGSDTLIGETIRIINNIYSHILIDPLDVPIQRGEYNILQTLRYLFKSINKVELFDHVLFTIGEQLFHVEKLIPTNFLDNFTFELDRFIDAVIEIYGVATV